jgi:hypothetical protein
VLRHVLTTLPSATKIYWRDLPRHSSAVWSRWRTFSGGCAVASSGRTTVVARSYPPLVGSTLYREQFVFF